MRPLCCLYTLLYSEKKLIILETIAPTKEASNEEVSIDLGASSSETKLQEETPNQKESLKSDKSICQLKPSEGEVSFYQNLTIWLPWKSSPLLNLRPNLVPI